MSLTIKQLNADYAGKRVLQDITLENIPTGSITVLLGPNAAGKSTFFKALSGTIKSYAEAINLHGDDWLNCSHKKRFQRLSYLPQIYQNDIALSVFESVLLGCKSATGGWHVSENDLHAVTTLLEQFNISHIAERLFSSISGGQQQLAAICQVLARQSDLLLFDEPSSALDLRLQLKTLQQIKIETEKRQAVCILSLHDLNLAAEFADQLIVINKGKVEAFDDKEKVIESEVLDDVYQVKIDKIKKDNGCYLLSPHIQ